MSTALLSPDEYIARSFEHDVEYVRGRLVSRAIPTYPHSRLQSLLAAAFFSYEKRLNLRGLIAQRVQVAPDIFRIPDICLIRKRPEKDYVTEPLILAVEILTGGTSTTVKDGIFRAGVVEVTLSEMALD